MWLHYAKLEETFRKVKAIQEHMHMCCLAPDRAKLSVEDLQWCIGDLYNIKIDKVEVAFEGAHVRGVVERYERRARILVRKNQEEDFVRFTTVKELCQIAVSEKEDWSVFGAKTLETLLYEVTLDLKDARTESDQKAPAHPIQSEKLAELAAIELMYPFKFRAADKEALEAGSTTLRALAVHFHTPEFVIGSALHPKHLEMAQEFWSKIGD
jgi:hypothetical protein